MEVKVDVSGSEASLHIVTVSSFTTAVMFSLPVREKTLIQWTTVLLCTGHGHSVLNLEVSGNLE